jgi:NAD(P)-dependent dehydrogenase (short-subunit alcohol dehydrogenase family)
MQADARDIETTGSGIGKACALLFAKEGAAGVMVADLDADAGGNVAAECRAVATNAQFRVERIHVDITLEASVEHATAQTVQAFGRIDYCVNCAGVSSSRSTRTCAGC